jgi:hypothetical protein
MTMAKPTLTSASVKNKKLSKKADVASEIDLVGSGITAGDCVVARGKSTKLVWCGKAATDGSIWFSQVYFLAFTDRAEKDEGKDKVLSGPDDIDVTVTNSDGPSGVVNAPGVTIDP